MVASAGTSGRKILGTSDNRQKWYGQNDQKSLARPFRTSGCCRLCDKERFKKSGSVWSLRRVVQTASVIDIRHLGLEIFVRVFHRQQGRMEYRPCEHFMSSCVVLENSGHLFARIL